MKKQLLQFVAALRSTRPEFMDWGTWTILAIGAIVMSAMQYSTYGILYLAGIRFYQGQFDASQALWVQANTYSWNMLTVFLATLAVSLIWQPVRFGVARATGTNRYR